MATLYNITLDPASKFFYIITSGDTSKAILLVEPGGIRRTSGDSRVAILPVGR